MTSFEKRVLAVTARIPRGRVATYKQIARKIGAPSSARAVGNALNKNPHPVRVPCHRVVASGGGIGGYASGIAKKIALLKREGVPVKKKWVDLRRYGVRW